MGIILRAIRIGWQGFKRNGWLSFISSFMMMQALLLTTLFVGLNVTVSQTIQAINEQIDVAIFFKEYIPQSEILTFKEQIYSIDGIKDIIFISQDQALESYIAQNQSNQDLLDIIGDDSSFLPASLEVKVTNPYLLESVVEKIEAADESGLISNTSLKKNQEVINQLRKINRFVSTINFVLGFIFIIIALLIIFNTIRIAIFTRREEIEIMKLVGATDWYIRWPFIVEGIIYGIAGALMTFILTLFGYWGVVSSVSSKYFAIDVTGTSFNLFNFWLAIELFVVQLLLGVMIGSISSYLSTKRYLRI